MLKMWTLMLFISFCAIRQVLVQPSSYLNYPGKKDLRSYYKSLNKTLIETKTEPKFEFGDSRTKLSCFLSLSKVEKIEGLSAIWFKDNVSTNNLYSSERFRVQEIGELIIDSPKRSDTGLYTVRFKKWIDSETLTHDCDVEYFGKPLVLDFPRSLNVNDGSYMSLQCNVKGYPMATLTWYKDGKSLKVLMNNSTRLELKPFNNYPDGHLTIRHVRFVDAGIYKCEAYSKFFRVYNAKEIKVRVIDKLAAIWPFLGLMIMALMLYLIIVTSGSGNKRRIRKQEEMLYRMSFAPVSGMTLNLNEIE